MHAQIILSLKAKNLNPLQSIILFGKKLKRQYYLNELKKLLESINIMLNLILLPAQLKINYFLLISKVKRSKIYPIEWE